MARAKHPLPLLRKICSAFPEATEQVFGGHTTPTWRVRNKIFAMFETGDGGKSVWCKAPAGAQQILVGSDPQTFFAPPYVGPKGWIGVRLGVKTDWEHVADLIADSYRMTAPKRLLASMDGAAAQLMAPHTNPLPRLRKICLSLPEATEKLSHGEPTFFVGGKVFVTFANNHHNDGRVAIWCNAAPLAQDVFVSADPERFFVPPYVGSRGWIGVRLDRDTDWDLVAEIVSDAWRTTAPKRLLAAVDIG